MCTRALGVHANASTQERVLENERVHKRVGHGGNSALGGEPEVRTHLPHCRQILYHLSHQGSPIRVSYMFLWIILCTKGLS